jgi:hypothetical protein
MRNLYYDEAMLLIYICVAESHLRPPLELRIPKIRYSNENGTLRSVEEQSDVE